MTRQTEVRTRGEPGRRGSGLSRQARRLGLAALAVASLPVLAGAADHVTPTVILKKQADVIRATLPGAAHFFVKTVKIGTQDLRRIESEGSFEPEDPTVRFYYGEDVSGKVVGAVLFPQVNTQHGPFEVGLTMDPNGTVDDVTVTKATVETKPWVETATSTGFLNAFRGLQPGQPATKALTRLKAADPGEMPTFAGEQIARAVKRGLTLYSVLYGRGGRG